MEEALNQLKWPRLLLPVYKSEDFKNMISAQPVSAVDPFGTALLLLAPNHHHIISPRTLHSPLRHITLIISHLLRC